jgi:pyridoxal phosphate enzyme (YggS family)
MTSSRTSSGEVTEQGNDIAAQIEKSLQEIQLAITQAAALAGRDAGEVLVVAVSKTVGIPEVAGAIQAGLHDFGENRTKLFLEKQEAFPGERWHYIGNIQTNKLKDVVGRAHLIHSVATLRALEAIDRLAGAGTGAEAEAGAGAERQLQRVLIEVNVSGEASKDGARPAEVPALLEAAAKAAHIKVEGLMTMAPLKETEHDSTARRTFAALRELRDNLVPIFEGAENISLNELSMGMSDDFADAIQEGSTIVRIGRRLWS